jgi:cell division protein FtsW
MERSVRSSLTSSRPIKSEKKEVIKHYDFTLLIVLACLVGFGLVMVCSASAYTAVKYGVESTYYLKKQATFALVGVILMIVISKFNYRLLIRRMPLIKLPVAVWAYIICLLLQVLVFIIGDSTNGSTRWLELPVIGKFQPSEVTKIACILMVAYMLSNAPRKLEKFSGFLVVCFIACFAIGLVVVENLSTALVMAGIVFIMCFIVSTKWWYFILSFFGLVAAATIGIMNVGYRADRINQWLNVEEEGYQILQGLYAVCSGGWFGKGLGNSVQKLGYIPEVHTDMIFAVICEELGILGVIVLLLVYGVLLWRIYKISINAPDLFGSLLCTGVFSHIALQILLNIAVVTNTVPSTGVTLPFISYGGTSIMAMFIEMGLVLSVAGRIEHEI